MLANENVLVVNDHILQEVFSAGHVLCYQALLIGLFLFFLVLGLDSLSAQYCRSLMGLEVIPARYSLMLRQRWLTRELLLLLQILKPSLFLRRVDQVAVASAVVASACLRKRARVKMPVVTVDSIRHLSL